MRKRMRACISLLLALALVLPPVLPAGAAGETFTEGNFTYTVDTNGQATVTGFANETATQAVVPAMLGGHPVTAIGAKAFYNCTALVEVTLPEGLTSIGD